MKNIKIILLAILLIYSSCKGFLDETDQDLFIPSHAEHYSSVLLDEFNYNGMPFTETQYMTDEVAEMKSNIFNSSYRENIKSIYTWQKNIEIREDGFIVDKHDTWENFYKCIAITNYILEEIDEAQGEEHEIIYVKAEAYFIRAYCYYVLTNLYAEPYIDENQAKATQGIPIKTDIGIETVYERDNLSNCYKQIETDLEKAIELFEKTNLKKSIYHPSMGSAKLLLSRVKLYKKEYGEVIKNSSYVIENYNLNTFNSYSLNNTFINKLNPEVIYSFFQFGGTISVWDLSYTGLSVSEELRKLYDENDLRQKVFFKVEGDDGNIEFFNAKRENNYSDYLVNNLRSAEAYLNRAEAYAYTNNTPAAINDLDELLKNRYLNGEGFNIPKTQNELIRFIENERFKELCFEENHRWFDLRRMSEENRPQIEHEFTLLNDDNQKIRTQKFILLKNDKNYTLSLPRKERNNNLFIRDYERFDKRETFN